MGTRSQRLGERTQAARGHAPLSTRALGGHLGGCAERLLLLYIHTRGGLLLLQMLLLSRDREPAGSILLCQLTRALAEGEMNEGTRRQGQSIGPRSSLRASEADGQPTISAARANRAAYRVARPGQRTFRRPTGSQESLSVTAGPISTGRKEKHQTSQNSFHTSRLHNCAADRSCSTYRRRSRWRPAREIA